MKVKNVSTRLHHVGDVSIAPGQEVELADSWLAAINPAELVVTENPKAKRAPAAASAPVAPTPAPAA